MFSDITGARTDNDVVVQPAPVQVDREKRVAILSGPIVAEIKHQPRMSMTTPENIIRVATARLLPGMARVPVIMVGVLLNQFISVRVEIFAVHSLVMRTGN